MVLKHVHFWRNAGFWPVATKICHEFFDITLYLFELQYNMIL